MPWLREVQHHTITLHQCQLGLKDFNGDFIKKPTRLVSSSPMVASRMTLHCRNEHTHASVQGRGQGVSSSLAEWTDEMGQAIMEGAILQMQCEMMTGVPIYDMQDVPSEFHQDATEVLHQDALRRSANVVFKELEDETEFNSWGDVPSMLRSAIIKVHRQYSHSLRGDELVRHLRLGGASESAINAAKLFKCETCEKEVRNMPRPVAAVPKYQKFGECIAMDVAFIPCMGDVLHAFLVMVDMATHFTVTSYLCSGEAPGETCKPNADETRKALLDWCEMLGIPQRCQIDQDSSFRGMFKSTLDTFGIEDIMVARDAHWSHGLVERRVLMLKEMIAKVAPEFKATGAIMMRVAMTQCTSTINRLSNNQGFSPAQCVLGANVNLPEVITGTRLHPAMQHMDFNMESRLHLQQLCEESFAKASHNSALRKVLLSQVRTQPGPFELHTMVMYKRKGLKHTIHHQWHGPARVIGKDIHGYWLIHRGMPILAHPNNMRRAVESEMHTMIEGDHDDDEGGPKMGQRGFLDLSKSIPDNPRLESIHDEGLEHHDFGDGLPSSRPEDRPSQSFEPPDFPLDANEMFPSGDELEMVPDMIMEPMELPDDLKLIEDKKAGWFVLTVVLQ